GAGTEEMWQRQSAKAKGADPHEFASGKAIVERKHGGLLRQAWCSEIRPASVGRMKEGGVITAVSNLHSILGCDVPQQKSRAHIGHHHSSSSSSSSSYSLLGLTRSCKRGSHLSHLNLHCRPLESKEARKNKHEHSEDE